MDLSQVGQVIVQYGIFGGLFVWLLKKTLDEGKKREEKLCNVIIENQAIIKALSEKFAIVQEIRNDIEAIKSIVDRNITVFNRDGDK